MSQKDKIKIHLLTGQSITAGEALLVYGCFRLAARIRELREDGMLIHAFIKRDANGKHYASYRIGTAAEVEGVNLETCRMSEHRKCDCAKFNNPIACNDSHGWCYSITREE